METMAKKTKPRPPASRGGGKIGRRTAMKATAAAIGLGPWIVRDALSSSGEIKIMIWSDYLPQAVTEPFEKATGIKIKQTTYGSNEELLNKLKAAKGRGFDLVSPTLKHMGLWKPLGLLRPWDMNRVPSEAIDKLMLESSIAAGAWKGGLHHIPFVWGTEGLAWRSDKWSPNSAELTYGDLWRPEMKGKIMGRPHSIMLTIGLYLDRIEKLPSNRMLDAYRDEDNMRRIWSKITEFAIAHKPWFKVFWDDAEAQINGFMHNGVVLGQTWDGPPTRLKNEGKPVTYTAPIEGGLGWIDGLSIPIGAESVDQVYEFLKFQYSPRNGALLANRTGYASCAAGTDKYLNEKMKSKMSEAYPNGAMNNLWWWPLEPPWYAAARAAFRDNFVAA